MFWRSFHWVRLKFERQTAAAVKIQRLWRRRAAAKHLARLKIMVGLGLYLFSKVTVKCVLPKKDCMGPSFEPEVSCITVSGMPGLWDTRLIRLFFLPYAGTHCAYPRRDGQAELNWTCQDCRQSQRSPGSMKSNFADRYSIVRRCTTPLRHSWRLLWVRTNNNRVHTYFSRKEKLLQRVNLKIQDPCDILA